MGGRSRVPGEVSQPGDQDECELRGLRAHTLVHRDRRRALQVRQELRLGVLEDLEDRFPVTGRHGREGAAVSAPVRTCASRWYMCERILSGRASKAGE